MLFPSVFNAVCKHMFFCLSMTTIMVVTTTICVTTTAIMTMIETPSIDYDYGHNDCKYD